jgi:hypothetical protein
MCWIRCTGNAKLGGPPPWEFNKQLNDSNPLTWNLMKLNTQPWISHNVFIPLITPTYLSIYRCHGTLLCRLWHSKFGASKYRSTENVSLEVLAQSIYKFYAWLLKLLFENHIISIHISYHSNNIFILADFLFPEDTENFHPIQSRFSSFSVGMFLLAALFKRSVTSVCCYL